MTPTNAIEDNDLHAYVDGELEAARRDSVASLLADQPDALRQVSDLQRINQTLRDAYAPVLEQGIPSRLLAGAPSARLGTTWRTAAYAVSLLAGVAIGMLLPRDEAGVRDAGRPVAREAAYAHAVYLPEVRHPVEVVAAEREHLNRWLSKRLDHPVTAPDIREAGYQLVGGRLLPDAGRPAAQFMYEDASGKRLTLYVRAERASESITAFRYAEEGQTGVVYWHDGALAYALAGPPDQVELRRVARLMYDAMTP